MGAPGNPAIGDTVTNRHLGSDKPGAISLPLSKVAAIVSLAAAATIGMTGVASAAAFTPTAGTTMGVIRGTTGGLELYANGPGGALIRATYANGRLSAAQNLGGKITGGVSAMRVSSSHCQTPDQVGMPLVSARSVNGNAYISSYGAADGSCASPSWYRMPGSALTRAAFNEYRPGDLEAYSSTRVGQLDRQLAVNPFDHGLWSGSWTPIGGSIQAGAAPAVDGNRRLFYTGSDRRLNTRKYHATYGYWLPPESLGGTITGDVAVTEVRDPVAGDWSYMVFARGDNNALYVRASGAPDWQPEWLGPWVNLGGVLSTAPAAVSGSDGRVDVVVGGTNGGIYLKSFVAGKWGSFIRIR